MRPQSMPAKPQGAVANLFRRPPPLADILYPVAMTKIPSRTTRMRPQWLLGLCTLVSAMQLSPCARAALGEDEASVAQDRVRLQAKVQIQRRSNYQVHDLALPTGASLREYVDLNGKVFAVAWSGGSRPNLRDVMGAHYDRYIAATRGQRRARGPVRVELPGMVVLMGGYLRTFWGQVYLTDQLPAGVTAEDLR